MLDALLGSSVQSKKPGVLWSHYNCKIYEDGTVIDIDGNEVDVQAVKAMWVAGEDDLTICIAHRLTLTLLLRLSQLKRDRFPRRNKRYHRYGPAEDPTPEQIEERARQIRETWNVNIEAERKLRVNI